jgi:2-keto-4-pentenoate hydratase
MNRDDERIIEGMRRQSEGISKSGAGGAANLERLGWKAGFGTGATMALIGTSQPLAGFLTKATLLDSGAFVQVGGWGVPLFEAEVAVRIDSEIGAGATAGEATAAAGAVAAAIELVDFGSIESVEEILAGNIFHRHVLLGEFVEPPPDGLDGVSISVAANGEAAEASDPREALGDLGQVVAALADQAALTGESIKPGDVVITGAAIPPAPVSPGDDYRVEITGGSSVTVKLV